MMGNNESTAATDDATEENTFINRKMIHIYKSTNIMDKSTAE